MPCRSGYDAIVVGAGPAGCVAAARLAEAGRATLLIEAGSGAELPPALKRAAVVDPLQASSWFWPAVPDLGAGIAASGIQPSAYWAGRGVGGGSLVNGAVLSPGDPEDFDRWRDEHGCSHWGSEQLEPWLATATRAMIADDPETITLGDRGEQASELEKAFDHIAGELGHGVVTGSTLDGGRRGLLRPATASVDGDRLTAAAAVLPRPGEQPNLEVVCGRMVTLLRSRRRRVSAVILDDGSELKAQTVVCAGGSIQTPVLLVRSGLAPRAGHRLKNHASFAVTVPWPDTPTTVVAASAPRVRRVLRWQTAPTIVKPQTDLTAYLLGPMERNGEAAAVVVVMLSVVRSVGRLHIDETSGPALVTAHLTDPVDLAAMVEGFRHTARLCATLTQILGVEPAQAGNGGVAVSTLARSDDVQLEGWLRSNPGPVYHAVATCAMGATDDGDAVCWAESGRAGVVRGVEGIVVADGSIFPDLVAGGLQLPIMAVADRIVSESLCQDR